VLPVPGRTEEGRRKFIERAVQIASIPAKAKEAAIKAGLANRRMKLVDIAQAKTIDAALSVIETFKAIKKIKALNKKQPEPSSPVEGSDLNKYREQVAAIEAGWQAASELRSALDKAPPAVLAWFAKHRLPQCSLTEGNPTDGAGRREVPSASPANAEPEAQSDAEKGIETGGLDSIRNAGFEGKTSADGADAVEWQAPISGDQAAAADAKESESSDGAKVKTAEQNTEFDSGGLDGGRHGPRPPPRNPRIKYVEPLKRFGRTLSDDKEADGA
jgi:hypothetical protein